MINLINQFTNDWKGEVEKQKTMSKRAREILLRWGCFSEDYVERAELLCDKDDDGEKIVDGVEFVGGCGCTDGSGSAVCVCVGEGRG